MPHSISKRSSSSSSTAPSPPTARSQEGRNKETALYHAQILQERKEVEAQILVAIETLLDLPSSATAEPENPSNSDAAVVRTYMGLFQPSDYDSLIEERNINKQCGYVLCPKPHRLQNTKARYRILYGDGEGKGSLKVVRREKLEQWCSDKCGKRALYIKVQLNEHPAWTRSATADREIVLLGDKPENQQGEAGTVGLIEPLKSLDIDQDERMLAAQMKSLAILRGDFETSSVSFSLAELHVREKVNTSERFECPIMDESTNGLEDVIEDYQPRFPYNVLRK